MQFLAGSPLAKLKINLKRKREFGRKIELQTTATVSFRGVPPSALFALKGRDDEESAVPIATNIRHESRSLGRCGDLVMTTTKLSQRMRLFGLEALDDGERLLYVLVG